MQRSISPLRWLRLVAILAALPLAATAATLEAEPGPAGAVDAPRAEDARGRNGEYCTFSSCRRAPASGWTAAAFGAAVVTIGAMGRRRGSPTT